MYSERWYLSWRRGWSGDVTITSTGSGKVFLWDVSVIVYERVQ